MSKHVEDIIRHFHEALVVGDHTAAASLAHELTDDMKPGGIHISANCAEMLAATLVKAARDLGEYYNVAGEFEFVSEEAAITSITDALTGSLNLRGFEQKLKSAAREIARETFQREHHGGAIKQKKVLVQLDLDGFKQVNDSCGHEAGDEALRQVMKKLEAELRARDVVARLGGDEIGLILTFGADEEIDFEAIRQGIRAKIAGIYFFDEAQKPYPIGASIGFAAIDEEHIDEIRKAPAEETPEGGVLQGYIEELRKTADLDMYRDKWGPEGESRPDQENAPKNLRLAVLRAEAPKPPSTSHE